MPFLAVALLLGACGVPGGTASAPGTVSVAATTPSCPTSTVTFTVRNAADGAVTLTLWRDGTPDPLRTTTLGGHATTTITYLPVGRIETLAVHVDTAVAWKQAVQRPAGCYTGPAVSWGTPSLTDDFSGGALDPATWYVYDYPDGTPRRSKSTVSVGGGLLDITGRWNATTGEHVGGGVSMSTHGQLYGKWEVKVRAAAGAGFSPTVLLWPDSEKWPQDGEIDMYETGPWPNRDEVLSVAHNGAADTNRGDTRAVDVSQWHTVSVEWTPTRITYYVDGAQWWSTSDRAVIPSTPMHLVLQNDAGCGWIACPSKTSPSSVAMQVDWVKQWALPAGAS